MTARGVVVELLPGQLARVRLETGQEITAHVAEELRRVTVPLKAGDVVSVRPAAHDPGRGSIVGFIGKERRP